jgi:alkylresorcinol/alkylpyrone synthase
VRFAERFFGASSKRKSVIAEIYANAQVETRYASVPAEWYAQDRSFEEKNDLYIETSLGLLKRVATESLDAAHLDFSDIDTIVTVSTTGIAVPTLDTRLMQELPFRRNVQRLPLFGFGCAGGALGLARAASSAQIEPGSHVLCLVVELCTLTFCPDDQSFGNIIATALFGDGAGAAVLTTDGTGPLVTGWGEHTWLGTLDILGWHATQRGLQVKLGRTLPSVARDGIREVTDEFLAAAGIELDDIDEFVCHPGGAKVLDALEAAFGLPAGGLVHARAILREYGNMSAATVLFILKRAMAAPARAKPGGRYLMTGLGPGFCIGFLLLELD